MTAADMERIMRGLLDQGVWPTAAKIGTVIMVERGGWPRPGERSPYRNDLNGAECKLRERLADEYGWHRVRHGLITRWEKAAA